MTVISIIIAVIVAFVAFRFIKGMLKLAVLAAIVLFGIFIAQHTGAF